MDKETLLHWYRQMVLIRTFEQKCSELYQQGKIGGFLHLYIGQEAVAVGSINARQENDHLITAYRDHAHAIMAGTDVKYLMAEMLGKATGISKGKGGSMHLADVSKNYWGGYGIVGGHVPLGVGIALAEQYKGTDSAVLCYMGDGSTNIGYFHEALNLAGVWDLPVLFIVENNQYGMGTAVERASAVKTMVEKAAAYGMKGKQVDAMNVFEVHNATQKALQAIRKGKAPQFLEMITYRFEGHSMGDPLRYRSKEEVHKWQENDPIGILEKHLLDEKEATQEEMDQIDEEVKQEIEAAVQFAEESPFPALESLFEDVYANDL
ncbi:MAG: pyruvate dehydrogenase (acetyl-transferring) E1 component subunit alpha [Anaerolineae bacterium]|nr:pyruvate dehydrogenase (acetyl-transferring) E1 component subunit alpha [Anaerolineae bacterium]